MSKKITKLTEKWLKAKSKLSEAQAAETAAKNDLDLALAKINSDKATVTIGTKQIDMSVQQNYSIPKAAITDIQANLPKSVFSQAFTTSYRLKTSIYENLTGDNKQVIKNHLTIKPAPLKITVKDI